MKLSLLEKLLPGFPAYHWTPAQLIAACERLELLEGITEAARALDAQGVTSPRLRYALRQLDKLEAQEAPPLHVVPLEDLGLATAYALEAASAAADARAAGVRFEPMDPELAAAILHLEPVDERKALRAQAKPSAAEVVRMWRERFPAAAETADYWTRQLEPRPPRSRDLEIGWPTFATKEVGDAGRQELEELARWWLLGCGLEPGELATCLPAVARYSSAPYPYRSALTFNRPIWTVLR